MLVAGLLLGIAAVGCGPKPPCPVGPSVVKSAQEETEETEAELQEAQDKRAMLENQLEEKQARLEELKGQPEKLEKKLEHLKQGSGR
jgi:peptidoglycan hydrolase CwlO-like protein